MADSLDWWDEWASACRERLEAGRLEYGDRSFSADPDELAREIEEECQDMGVWSFILSRRARRLRAAAARLRAMRQSHRIAMPSSDAV